MDMLSVSLCNITVNDGNYKV